MFEKIFKDFWLLFVTIDPVGLLAIFYAIAGSFPKEERNALAKKACLYSALILEGSILVGQLVLSALSIQIISLQVAGSIILFLFGLQMIFSSYSSKKGEAELGHDIAVFPLAVPGMAGPGSIMAVILITDSSLHTIYERIVTAVLVLLVIGLSYILMRIGEPILKVMGKNGLSILEKVLGLLLTALSIELLMKVLQIPGWVIIK